MKSIISLFALLATFFVLYFGTATATDLSGNRITDTTKKKSYFIDVHDLEPGKVTFDDVEKAHQKDLATQNKYDVNFLKFWVDEAKGKVYCLSQAKDAASVEQTHKEAHGLMPSVVYHVTEGQAAEASGNNPFFIDVHQMGAGKVTAKDVADAHAKDLAVQHKYGVNFIDYWVDEEKGTILCLSEAPDTSAVIKAHSEAHGLLPAYILKVNQGQ